MKHPKLFALHTGRFSQFAKATATATGKPATFVLAVAIISIWAITGPLFGFSDTWQLAINTSTTIITFLMVFLIQNTQNRDSQALQIKVDELLRAIDGAHNALIDLEELTDEELCLLKNRYLTIARKGRVALRKGKPDTGSPLLEPQL